MNRWFAAFAAVCILNVAHADDGATQEVGTPALIVSVILMTANWLHVSGCRAGRECVFHQEGKVKFDFKPAAQVPAGE